MLVTCCKWEHLGNLNCIWNFTVNQKLVLYSAKPAVLSLESPRLRYSFDLKKPSPAWSVSRCVLSNLLCCSEATVDIISREWWCELFLPVAPKGGNSCLLIPKPFNIPLKPVCFSAWIHMWNLSANALSKS